MGNSQALLFCMYESSIRMQRMIPLPDHRKTPRDPASLSASHQMRPRLQGHTNRFSKEGPQNHHLYRGHSFHNFQRLHGVWEITSRKHSGHSQIISYSGFEQLVYQLKLRRSRSDKPVSGSTLLSRASCAYASIRSMGFVYLP